MAFSSSAPPSQRAPHFAPRAASSKRRAAGRFQRRKPLELERACRTGEGLACRFFGLNGPGLDSASRLRALRKGCLLGDIEGCGELALRDDSMLRYEQQQQRAGALGLGCGAGQTWACNDLAFLIGKLAEENSSKASCLGSRHIMQDLLEHACKAADALACQNRERLQNIKDKERLDTLKPSRLRAN